MTSVERELERLERQALALDQLERYVLACVRRGSTDEVAESALVEARRQYRRTLSRTSVEALFLYGCKAVQSRQM